MEKIRDTLVSPGNLEEGAEEEKLQDLSEVNRPSGKMLLND